MRDSTRGCAAWFKAFFSRDNRAFTAALIAVIVLGAVLRFSRLTFQSLWLDELHSLLCSRPEVSLRQLLRAFARGGVSHPPLYFVGLHAWFDLFGFSEWSARAFSAVGGVLGLVSLYYLGKEARGRTCGLVACLLGLFNYFHVYYSQEARAYAWMFFLGASSLAFLIRYLRHGGVRSLAAYLAMAITAMLTHYYGVILVVSQLLTTGLIVLSQSKGRQKTRRLLAFLLGGGAIAILYVPQAVVISRTVPRKRNFWIGAPDSRMFMDMLKEFFGKDRSLLLAFGVLVLVAAAAFLFARRRPKGPSANDPLRVSVPTLLGVVFFGFLLPYIFSIVSIPMLTVRYEIILLPAILTLMAVGVTVFRQRTVVAVVTAGLVFVSAFRLVVGKQYYTRVKKEQWREAAQHAVATSETLYPGQRVLYYSSESRSFHLYMELLGEGVRVRPARRGDLERRTSERAEPIVGVWVLRAHHGKEAPSFLGLLTHHFTSVHRREWRGANAELYAPRSIAAPASGKVGGT